MCIRDRYEIDERAAFDGTIEKKVTKEMMQEVTEALKGKDDSISVCLINSYAKTDNEKEVCRILEEELEEGTIITASHEIAKESREYERVSTSVLNAYVAPSTRRHVFAPVSYTHLDVYKRQILSCKIPGAPAKELRIEDSNLY